MKRGKILLMDDDRTVLCIIEEMLTIIGYQVSCATDGEEACAEYFRVMEDEPFDLLFLDLTVPGGMGGKECLARIRQVDPAVRAVAASGDSSDEAMINCSTSGFIDHIDKPFTIEKMEATITKALNSTAG
jgi:two-component system, cell cycle sensor histidine kinase and response regulator CckA